jgi:hypothetical protein
MPTPPILPQAAGQIAVNDLPEDIVRATLADPARIARLPGGAMIYMRRYFDQALQRDMLMRAFVEEVEGKKSVVSVQRTAEIEKYFPWVSE